MRLPIILMLLLPINVAAETEEFAFDLSGYTDRHLRVNLLNGNLVVRGHDGEQILVTADITEQPAPEMTADESGLMVLPNLGQELKVHQDGEMVIVRAGTQDQPVQLAIQVPESTHLTLTVRQGGDIRVEGVSGEMELQNSTGRIDLEGVRNTVVAHAHADGISASFSSAGLPGPSSFSSWSGNVELDFPENINADFRWRTNYGKAASDFAVTNVRTETLRNDEGTSASVETFTIGSVNGGGPEISATSYSGDVTFRKSGN